MPPILYLLLHYASIKVRSLVFNKCIKINNQKTHEETFKQVSALGLAQ